VDAVEGGALEGAEAESVLVLVLPVGRGLEGRDPHYCVDTDTVGQHDRFRRLLGGLVR